MRCVPLRVAAKREFSELRRFPHLLLLRDVGRPDAGVKIHAIDAVAVPFEVAGIEGGPVDAVEGFVQFPRLVGGAEVVPRRRRNLRRSRRPGGSRRWLRRDRRGISGRCRGCCARGQNPAGKRWRRGRPRLRRRVGRRLGKRWPGCNGPRGVGRRMVAEYARANRLRRGPIPGECSEWADCISSSSTVAATEGVMRRRRVKGPAGNRWYTRVFAGLASSLS